MWCENNVEPWCEPAGLQLKDAGKLGKETHGKLILPCSLLKGGICALESRAGQ